MASWIDEVDSAPRERPDGFAMPRTEPLADAPAAPSLAAGQPPVAPEHFEDTAGHLPLDRLVPRTAPGRDPQSAFEVASSMAASATAVLDPREPIITSAPVEGPGGLDASSSSAGPRPLDPTWAPPLEDQLVAQDPPAGALPTPTVAEAARMVGVPALVALLVGTVLSMTSFTMLFVVICLGIARPDPFGLPLRRIPVIAAALAITIPFVLDFQEDPLTVLGTTAQVGCGVSLLVLALMAWQVLLRRQPMP